MNPDEAAEYIRIGTRMLNRLVAEGKIARIKLGDANKSAVRFKKKDLDRFVEEHRIPSIDERLRK